jgi:nucleotide-binding universal stress UspA family protein
MGMAFKDIVVVLRGFPTPTPPAAVDDAVELAALLGARLSGIACATTPRVPRSILGDALINVSGLVAAESHKIAVSAQAALTTFQGAAAKRGVLGQHILHKCQTSEVAGALADYARLRDLAILPMPEGDYLQQFDSQWYAETIIFESGHPTIVLPYDRKGGRPITLNTVVVAWDNSRAAARAVADALPILRQAKITRVVTVTNEKAILAERSAAELLQHLALHGVNAVLDSVDAAGRAIGPALSAYASSYTADLMVMGAYGHSRFREFILGGATKSMLTHPPMPVFLSH